MKFDELANTWQYKTVSSGALMLHEFLLVIKAMGSGISWWLVFAPLISLFTASFVFGLVCSAPQEQDKDDPYKGD